MGSVGLRSSTPRTLWALYDWGSSFAQRCQRAQPLPFAAGSTQPSSALLQHGGTRCTGAKSKAQQWCRGGGGGAVLTGCVPTLSLSPWGCPSLWGPSRALGGACKERRGGLSEGIHLLHAATPHTEAGNHGVVTWPRGGMLWGGGSLTQSISAASPTSQHPEQSRAVAKECRAELPLGRGGVRLSFAPGTWSRKRCCAARLESLLESALLTEPQPCSLWLQGSAYPKGMPQGFPALCTPLVGQGKGLK